MGQYLSVGMITEFSVSKKDLEKTKLILQEVSLKAKFDESIYQMEEKEGYYNWTLKKEVLETHLLDFLEKFYPTYYKSDEEYADLLSKLQGKNADDILELAENKSEFAFQFDKYAESSYLRFEEKPFRPAIRLNFEGISLAMVGKIMMEEYGSMFEFFTESLQIRFQNNPLSKTLKVYISG